MTTVLTSIDRARQYLAKIPGAVSGQGGHNQTFSVACALVNGFALSEYDAYALLSEYNQRCAPPWSERELKHKIASAAMVQHDKPRGHLLGEGKLVENYHQFAHRTKPKVDPATATENFLRGFRCTEFDLWSASPITPPSDWRLGAAVMLPYLWFDTEFMNLNCDYELKPDGKAGIKGSGVILPRNEWTQRLSKAPFEGDAGAWIRMNPTLQRGSGKGGSVCDSDVTAFRFALLEWDDALPLELQLPLLAKLPLPIAAIITSGGKSVHAWVRVDAKDMEDYKADVPRLIDLLTPLGIDGKNKNPGRYSRLPGAQRKIGAQGNGRQRLVYLNPNPAQKAIL